LKYLLLAPLVLSTSALAQSQEIGVIDFYGARTIPIARLREALKIREGDSITPEVGESLERLKAVPGVERAAIDAVCCEGGKTTLYVGIEESGTAALVFSPPPTGTIELPEVIVRGYRDFETAFEGAIRAGDFAEDDSQGHSLMHFPAARTAQERFVALASEHRAALTRVLHQSANQEHRAIAAQVLAYSPGKKEIVADLARATRDPHSGVRNNAVRALALIAGFGQRHPDRGIVVSAEPLVDLLNSLVWTDRNKSSMALLRITETRDPAVLALIKARALPALIEMAQWKAMGHATAPLLILGRIAGMEDAQLFAALERNQRDIILEAVRP
jgi:hypothetical protein